MKVISCKKTLNEKFGPVKGTLRRDITTIHKYLMVENINTRQCWSESKFRSMIKKDFFLTVNFRQRSKSKRHNYSEMELPTPHCGNKG